MTTAAVARLTIALADRYRLERELGAGGMATLWLAHDLQHNRPVALKLLGAHEPAGDDRTAGKPCLRGLAPGRDRRLDPTSDGLTSIDARRGALGACAATPRNVA